MTTMGIVEEDKNLEKQVQKHMGCMAGFMQIFDRHHIFTGKRLSPSKVDTTPETEISDGSPELRPPMAEKRPTASTEAVPAKSPRTPPAFELKEGTRSTSWKLRESPRLSLDSRATVDAKGSLSLCRRRLGTNGEIENSGDGSGTDESEKQRRSTGVIARLMGLDPDSNPIQDPGAKSELRRSVSESRVCRDLFQSRLILEGSRFQAKQLQLQQQSILGLNPNGIAMRNSNKSISRVSTTTNDARKREPNYHQMEHEYSWRAAKVEQPKGVPRGGAFPGGSCSSPMKLPQQRRRFDSGDIFPGPRQSMGGEAELPSRDLETLKQILEGLHLKGLLHHHSKGLLNSDEHIIVMRPSRSMPPIRSTPRIRNDFPPSSFSSKSPRSRRDPTHPVEIQPPASIRKLTAQTDRSARNQSSRARDSNSPSQSDSSAKSSNSVTARSKALHVETRRKPNETLDHRRASPVNSPRSCCRATGGSSPTVSRSPRYRKPTAAANQPKEKKIPVPFQTEDESSSSVSDGCSLSTSSHTESERWKEGGSLLERCGKLLHSIEEITTTELQPSPVSVLDSSFYKDESSPSPVMKRSIDFRDVAAETEDEFWSPEIPPEQAEERLGDNEFVYVSEIIRALNYFPEDSDVFELVEKQRSVKGKSAACGYGEVPDSKLQRKLIFDTVHEIVYKKRRCLLPPWKAVSCCQSVVIARPLLQEIWEEYQRIRDTSASSSEDASEEIGGCRWGEWPSETSELVLDIERQVFKDLISETIQSSAWLGGRIDGDCCAVVPRRKLVF